MLQLLSFLFTFTISRYHAQRNAIEHVQSAENLALQAHVRLLYNKLNIPGIPGQTDKKKSNFESSLETFAKQQMRLALSRFALKRRS